MAVTVDIKQLLDAGAHFGHKTSRWHPKMAPFIHSKRGDIHIIDLVQTQDQLEAAIKFVEQQVSGGKQILFVGTKRQAQTIVKKVAEDNGQSYVTERWLGGMLTNSKTMNGRVKHLKSLEEKMASGELESRYNKLEVQRFQEEIDRLNLLFGGVKDMKGQPGAVFVTDVAVDNLAVKEANKLGIPVVGICDTNADPSDVDYPVAANDDAIKSVELITEIIGQAVAQGKTKIKAAPKPKTTKESNNDKKEEAEAKPTSKDESKKPVDKKTSAKKGSEKK